MINLKIEQSKEKINSMGGLCLVGQILSASNFDNLPDSKYFRSNRICNKDILLSYLGLLVHGKNNYEEISNFKNNLQFIKSLGISQIPSSSILRQRLEQLSRDSKILTSLKEINKNLLSFCNIDSLIIDGNEYIPLDIDGTPMDNSKSNKENVSKTYKLFDGYLAMCSYLGTTGYLINNCLHPGSDHCNNDFVPYLKQSIVDSESVISKSSSLLVRLDGGHDSKNVREELLKHSKVSYIIKRNIRKESKEMWLARAKALGTISKSKDGYKKYIGYYNEDSTTKEEIVFSVSEQTMDENGQYFLTPEIEVETYYTNLFTKPETIIELYHNHGTSEQFHSELKNDLDIERLPSGKFDTNQLILQLAMLAFNCLRRIGVDLLEDRDIIPVKIKINTKRRKIRKVIQDIIYSPCKFIKTARRYILKFGCDCYWYKVIKKLYLKYSYI